MKRLKTILTAGILLATTGVAYADSDPSMQGSWESDGKVGITSNYIFRGETMSNRTPAIQGEVNTDYIVKDGAVFANIFATSVNLGDRPLDELDPSMRTDLEVGYKWDIGNPFTWRGGARYSVFPSSGWTLFDNPDISNSSVDYGELFADVGYIFDAQNANPYVTGGVNWSPDYFGVIDDTFYFTGGAGVVYNRWNLGATVGYLNKRGVKDSNNPTDYNLFLIADLEPVEFEIGGTWISRADSNLVDVVDNWQKAEDGFFYVSARYLF